MDLNLSPEDEAFRVEVRNWIKDNLPEPLRNKVADGYELGREDLLSWHRILAKKGWIAPAWPVQWGGTDWTPAQRYLFEQECGLASAPMLVNFGLVMCAQVLLKFGTEVQKQRFLPKIYDGSDFWCQGYSEPGAGSDLAAISTRAEKRGDSYLVNGQKIWTSFAHHADWIFCLVRTSASEKKQQGISFLLIDLKTPGITIRPLPLMNGWADPNEVFFDNVVVPAENLVHLEGEGWTVAKYLLGHERLNAGRIGISKRLLKQVKQRAALSADGRGGRLLDDPRFRDRLSRVEIELMALEITNLRFLDALRGGRQIGPEVSMLKIRGTEIQQNLHELSMLTAGALAAPRHLMGTDLARSFETSRSHLTANYAGARATSIYAGSNEIQRNILSKHLLGL